jgi:hypothetical protein
MKIDVYDTYATFTGGKKVHFDVFLETGQPKSKALEFANLFLKELGETTHTISLDQCEYCHREVANPNVKKQIEMAGYYILKMEGCPD